MGLLVVEFLPSHVNILTPSNASHKGLRKELTHLSASVLFLKRLTCTSARETAIHIYQFPDIP